MEKGSQSAQAEDLLSAANKARWELGMNFHDTVIESIYEDASRIARRSCP